MCTPSRSSLLTGASAARTHITNWTGVNLNDHTDYPDSLWQTPDWNNNGLSPSPIAGTYVTQTLPQILLQSGYYTLQVGKAHWGSQGSPGSDPLNLGFMTGVGGSAIGNPQSYYGLNNFGNVAGKTTPGQYQGFRNFMARIFFFYPKRSPGKPGS